jgi:hypothetical protein
MSSEFFAEKDASPELAFALMRLAPANPFCTRAYAEAMREDGHQPWLLGIKRKGQLVAGCYGFVFSGRLNRGLQISSVPDVPCDDDFWDGLLEFCSLQRITCLELQSFASSATHIPRLPGEVERQQRCEYVLDLGDREWEQRVAQKHRYNIRKALQAGVTLRNATGADACRAHVLLMAATWERLRKRGVSILFDVERLCAWSLLLTEKGAGVLFQAVTGGKALSSVMVLRAAEGVYEETAGTSPEGMRCGASHFLIYSIARALQKESVRVFNLGGAESNPGLNLFKSRFGATPVFLESARSNLGSDFRRKLTNAARSLRQSGASVLRRIGVVSDL